MTSSFEPHDHDPSEIMAATWFVVDTDDGPERVRPCSAEEALNLAKENHRAAEYAEQRHNASDWDHTIAERADRRAQTFALLAIAESLIGLTYALREVRDRLTDPAHEGPDRS